VKIRLRQEVEGVVWNGDNPDDMPKHPVVEVLRDVPHPKYDNVRWNRVRVRNRLLEPGDVILDDLTVIGQAEWGEGQRWTQVTRRRGAGDNPEQ
jgi:hypothetical protein